VRRLRPRLPGPGSEPLVSVARSVLPFALAFFVAGGAGASPQAHVAYRTGVCGVGSESLWQDTRWCNGVVGDLILGRERNDDFGLGPYVEVSSAGFWDARYGGGLSVLAPVTADFPLVLSFGAFGHEARSVALGGSLFFGLRSYNFHGTYNYSLGLVASGYRDLAADHETLLSIGLELDGFFLVAPFLLAAAALQ
jgi:hypothetical protein